MICLLLTQQAFLIEQFPKLNDFIEGKLNANEIGNFLGSITVNKRDGFLHSLYNKSVESKGRISIEAAQVLLSSLDQISNAELSKQDNSFYLNLIKSSGFETYDQKHPPERKSLIELGFVPKNEVNQHVMNFNAGITPGWINKGMVKDNFFADMRFGFERAQQHIHYDSYFFQKRADAVHTLLDEVTHSKKLVSDIFGEGRFNEENLLDILTKQRKNIKNDEMLKIASVISNKYSEALGIESKIYFDPAKSIGESIAGDIKILDDKERAGLKAKTGKDYETAISFDFSVLHKAIDQYNRKGRFELTDQQMDKVKAVSTLNSIFHEINHAVQVQVNLPGTDKADNKLLMDIVLSSDYYKRTSETDSYIISGVVYNYFKNNSSSNEREMLNGLSRQGLTSERCNNNELAYKIYHDTDLQNIIKTLVKIPVEDEPPITPEGTFKPKGRIF